MKYGEILFLGKCNCKCYYCLSNEMSLLKSDKENQMNIHFTKWNNFNKYIKILKENNINKIYLSSVITEPMMYKHLGKLVGYLQKEGFKVGIRSNGYLALNNMNTLLKLDEEISFSINSLNNNTCTKICGNIPPDFNKIFKIFDENNKKCRVSIVINKYNENEIFDILDYLNKFKCITYVQLRKVYKYNNFNNNKNDILSFNNVYNKIKINYNKYDNYFESEIYNYHGLKVSIWEDVFKKDSIQSFNYFTNGDISTHNLLIPAYEKKEGCLNE